jgi:methyltransferase (TIGR00027 family)
MPELLIQNVSDTAFWIAHYRAQEGERPDALFHDPLAGLLAGERGKKIATGMPWGFMTRWTVVIRTCLIDDYLRRALAEGVDTVLSLGAGLDTRPYRLELPESLTWVEADHPQIIEHKEARLAGEMPRCCVERAKLDLTDHAERRALLSKVNARAKKLLILTEGVVPYLSVEEAGALADDLRALDRACYWIVDYIAPQTLKYRQWLWSKRWVRNVKFKFTPDDWFGFFAGHGWRIKEIRYLAEEAERLHRPIEVPLPLKIFFKVRGLFSSKKRRAAFRKFSGYILLEPASAENPA